MLLLTTVSTILITINSYIWSIIFIILKLFRIHLFKLYGSKVQKFKKQVYCSSVICDDEPYGLVFGKYYIGYIEYTWVNQSNEWTLHILTTQTIYNKLFGNNSIQANQLIDVPSYVIKFYEREGPFYNLKYNSRVIDFETLKPKPKQRQIMNNIIDYYNINNNAISLIYGPSNTGKSMIPLLLSNCLKNKYNISYVDTYNPSDPGDLFSKLYTKIEPNKENPLIVLIDEIDILINKLHNKLINNHKDLPIEIKNKQEWNMFFDRFDRKLYPYVIFIMTSNQYPSYFEQMDNSYIREGRINLMFELK
jgi:hypothetical protein